MRHVVQRLITAVALGAAVISVVQPSAGAATPPPSPTQRSADVRSACPRPTTPGEMECFAQLRTDVKPRHGLIKTRTARGTVVPDRTGPAGYGPADLRSAYALPTGQLGSGRTVAIVDVFDDPQAEADLAIYRQQYGLSACTTANGCFRKVGQDGTSHYPQQTDPGWISEMSLDLDMVSAVCPNCHLLLVEADGPYADQLGPAENTAVKLGAKFVSNSFGTPEYKSDLTSDTKYYSHPGVVMTAATGDYAYFGDGNGAYYPAAAPGVVAVGGTSLSKTKTGRGWTEKVWSDGQGGGAGSGCSLFEPKPAWQHDSACRHRMTGDVSAVADPATGVAVYDSTPDSGQSGWQIFGGTSASTPIIAATYALAGPASPAVAPGSYFYGHGYGLNDVTAGSNGSCRVAYWCHAEPGYDGPTGWGTPNGLSAFTKGAIGDTGPIRSGLPNLCLDDNRGGSTNGNKVQVWGCNGSGPQSWSIRSDGTVRIAGRCLDVHSAGVANGSKVDLWSCNGSGAQIWRQGLHGSLINWHSGKCLDDPKQSPAFGTQQQIYTCNGTPAQSWQLP